MPGPPSLLESDPTLKARFLELIRDGVPRAYACLGCGFSYDTLYGWVRRGLVPDAPEPYASLARELYETEVELLRGWLKQLSGRALPKLELETRDGEAYTRDGVVDARALSWLLERRFPKAFGPNAYDPAQLDPIEEQERELRAEGEKTAQLEAGGDGGQLDEQRWSMMEEWFLARPARLLELARKTGLAQAAVEEGQGAREAHERKAET